MGFSKAQVFIPMLLFEKSDKSEITEASGRIPSLHPLFSAPSSNFHLSRISRQGVVRGAPPPFMSKKLPPRHRKDANSGYLNHIIIGKKNYRLPSQFADFCKEISLFLCASRFADNWKHWLLTCFKIFIKAMPIIAWSKKNISKLFDTRVGGAQNLY